MRVHWKIRLLEEGWGSRKTNIEGAISKKVGGLGQLVDLRGGGAGLGGAWQKRGNGVFEWEEGGWYPNAHNVSLFENFVSV